MTAASSSCCYPESQASASSADQQRQRRQRRRLQIATAINDTGGKFSTGQNLKKKIYLYANSATERYPKEITKTFLIEDFFHLHLELRISPRILEIFEKAPMV
jgi:hypothetical protein